MSGFAGIGFYLTLVSKFGGAAAVTVTTCRKVVTIAISFLLFPKPFDPLYLYTSILILLGIYLSFQAKRGQPGPDAAKKKEETDTPSTLKPSVH
mmetsp:Transcript_29893/g.70301  ORF Transcript_29893/g.70301 Transcript_29893/m.70301 type:complete len:94 (-) Transcript_29893:722-1003(-)